MKLQVLFSLWICGACLRAEPVALPLELGTFRTLDNKVYEGTKVIGKDAVGIRIMHEGGTARIPYGRLPKDLAEKFEMDPEAAKAQLAKEAAEGVAHEREAEMALKNRKREVNSEEGEEDVFADEEDGEPEMTVEKLPELSDKEAVARILALQQYVSRMEANVTKAEKEIEYRVVRAWKVQRRTRDKIETKTDPDRFKSKYQLDYMEMTHDEFVRRIAGKQQAKVNEGKELIRQAQAEIRRLKYGED